MNGMKFMGISAKTASKIQEAFELLTNEIIKASINKEKGLEKKENNIKLFIFLQEVQILLERKKEDIVKILFNITI